MSKMKIEMNEKVCCFVLFLAWERVLMDVFLQPTSCGLWG